MSEEIKRPEATESHWPRSDYKTVWTNLSDTLANAKLYIAGSEDEGLFIKADDSMRIFCERRSGSIQSTGSLKLDAGSAASERIWRRTVGFGLGAMFRPT